MDVIQETVLTDVTTDDDDVANLTDIFNGYAACNRCTDVRNG